MPASSHLTHAGAARPAPVGFAIVAAVALVLGFLTAYAQAWLPEDLGSLANSSGVWALVAFALALLASDARTAALYGCVALIALLVGYVLGTSARGFASGTALVVFWGAAAIVVGPALGLGAHWVKTETGLAAAVGIGVMSGVLIGEGVYGLAYIADTTYPPYWWGEVIVGVVLLSGVASRRLEGPGIVAIAVAVCALTATAFVLIYSQDLISVLP
jgi:Family of unknown function (DUF6518)